MPALSALRHLQPAGSGRARRALRVHCRAAVERPDRGVASSAVGDPAQYGTHAHALAYCRVADELVADRKEAHPSIEGRGGRPVPCMSDFPALLYRNLNIAVAQRIPVQTVESNTSGSCRSHNEATGSLVGQDEALQRHLMPGTACRAGHADGPRGVVKRVSNSQRGRGPRRLVRKAGGGLGEPSADVLGQRGTEVSASSLVDSEVAGLGLTQRFVIVGVCRALRVDDDGEGEESSFAV